MERVDKAICNALGFTTSPVKEPTLTYEPTAAEIERNLYKNLYEQLLDRITVKPFTEENENEHRRNVQ